MHSKSIWIALGIAVVTACSSSTDISSSADPLGGQTQPTEQPCAADLVKLDSCTDDATIKNAVETKCTKLGFEVTELALDHACKTGSLSYKYQCCPPKPPPVECEWHADNAGGCAPDVKLETLAELACKSEGRSLRQFFGDQSCGKSVSLWYKFECCIGGPPPVPAPQAD